MPAHSDKFPWPSYYGHFDFFENAMRRHNRVQNLEAHGGGRYTLTLSDGRNLTAFICECYSYGVAEYYETVEKIGQVDVVVISSNWCHYSSDVKLHCRNEKVGVFDIKGIMAALNNKDFWLYLDEWEEKKFKEKGWI